MPAKKILLPMVGEGALILVVGAIGWAAGWPFLFTSLGPTAFELVEKPKSPSAKFYNVVVGHFVALAAGFLSLWIFGRLECAESSLGWFRLRSKIVDCGGCGFGHDRAHLNLKGKSARCSCHNFACFARNDAAGTGRHCNNRGCADFGGHRRADPSSVRKITAGERVTLRM